MLSLADLRPEDVRIRFEFCWSFLHDQPRFPALCFRPSTVLIGVRRGRAEVAYGRPEKPSQILDEGDVILIPAGERRHTRTLSPGGAELWICGFFFEVYGGVDALRLLNLSPHWSEEESAPLWGLFSELLAWEQREELEAHGELCRAVARQRIGCAFFEALLKQAAVKENLRSFRRLAPVLREIDEHYCEALDLERLVALSGVSRKHFFRVFKEQTGRTPGEYLKWRRLQEAMLLLQDGRLHIAEIARRLGWEDPFYFSRVFKQATGLSPRNYQRKSSTLF